ncbi:hypothetical protein GS866_08740 [Rhodococcus hoagii]|nr:hypothetical protein [Prescottella equi]
MSQDVGVQVPPRAPRRPCRRLYATSSAARVAKDRRRRSTASTPRIRPRCSANRLDALARRKDATSAQLALAWLLTRRDYVVPIPGSRNPSRVAQNIAASDLVLDAEDLRAVDRVAGGGGIGNRN